MDQKNTATAYKKKCERQKNKTFLHTNTHWKNERKIIQLWMGFVYSGADLWQKRFSGIAENKM